MSSRLGHPWQRLVLQARTRLAGHPYWVGYLSGVDTSKRGLHLWVLKKGMLEEVLFGIRKSECQSFRSAREPFERVARGDVVFLKGSGRPVCGLAMVSKAWMYEDLTLRDQARLSQVLASRALSLSSGSPSEADTALRTMLLTFGHICTFPIPIQYDKSDPRSWVVLRPPRRPLLAKRYLSDSDLKAISRGRKSRSDLGGEN